VKLDPNDSQYHQNASIVWHGIGRLRQESGETARARDAFDAAVRAGRRATEIASKDGENWRALYRAQWFLAACREQQGETPEALRLLRDALKSAEYAAQLLPQDRLISEHVATLREWVAKRSR
jgi:tetratricopeptide (TPR) repeat protein